MQIWLALCYLDVDKIELFQVTHPNVTSSPKKSHVGRAFSNDPNQRWPANVIIVFLGPFSSPSWYFKMSSNFFPHISRVQLVDLSTCIPTRWSKQKYSVQGDLDDSLPADFLRKASGRYLVGPECVSWGGASSFLYGILPKRHCDGACRSPFGNFHILVSGFRRVFVPSALSDRLGTDFPTEK